MSKSHRLSKPERGLPAQRRALSPAFWYAVLALPLLFASGMSLSDTLDGAFMQAAYQWAFVRPVRKVYDNPTTTRSAC